MKYKIITKVPFQENEGYIGRVVSRETLNPIAFLTSGVINVYFLEVQNKLSRKRKRKRIGTEGVVVGDGSHPIYFYTNVQSIKFTEKGLEAVVSGAIDEGGFFHSPTTNQGKGEFIIPKEKFPY